jgi:hypothetical protein
MNKNIKNFSEFRSLDESFNFGSLFGNLGDVGADLIKSKIVEYLIGYVGVSEDSLLGLIISKSAQTLDFSEYWDLLTLKGDFPVSKVAPKLADATIEVISDIGIDGIASKLNSSLDKSGLVYRAFKEMITNQSRQKDFRDNLISMWTWILSAGGSSKSSKNSAFKLSKKEANTLLKDPALKNKGMDMTDLLKNLTGGQTTSQGKSLIGK